MATSVVYLKFCKELMVAYMLSNVLSIHLNWPVRGFLSFPLLIALNQFPELHFAHYEHAPLLSNLSFSVRTSPTIGGYYVS